MSEIESRLNKLEKRLDKLATFLDLHMRNIELARHEYNMFLKIRDADAKRQTKEN